MANDDSQLDDLTPLDELTPLDPLASSGGFDSLEPLDPLASSGGFDSIEPLDPLASPGDFDSLEPLTPLDDASIPGPLPPAASPTPAPTPAPAPVSPPGSAVAPVAARGSAAPVAASLAVGPADDDEDEEDDDELDSAVPSRRFSLRGMLRSVGAVGTSMIVHAVGIVVLALMTLDDQLVKQVQTLISAPVEDRPVDEPVEVQLDEKIEVVTEEQVAMFTTAPAMGLAGAASAAVGTPTLDATVVESAEPTQIAIEAPTIGLPDSMQLIEAVPEGDVKGEARDIVENYQVALDRITQELIWMLDKGPVLVVWLFDQSESMKDDQQEIRDRIQNVYNQLGISTGPTGDALLTAVCSFGGTFKDHTAGKGTSDRGAIIKAIDEVPIDETGMEITCQAVGLAITAYRRAATRGRQLVVVLVSDESGDPGNNERYLEAAIQAARQTRTKIYVLGREAVFGYPYAYIRWVHPQTNRVHWLQIDRGPETAFPEQLQTNGFHRRYDAFSSGFGPFEHARMARETNGVFFMLPSVEDDLVGKEQKRQYELEAMRPYRPDLRAKAEAFADREKYPLRTLIWSVIQDLNPHNKQAAKAVEMRVEFATTLPEFTKQAREEQQKAISHLRYMAEAEKALAQGQKIRDQEADPRWQANYDLIFAQIVAYQARMFEYGVALEHFIKNPLVVPLTKAPNLHLEHFDIRTVAKMRTEEAKPYADRATVLLQAVIDRFPGTPWAERAKWEIGRGYGVEVVPDYHPPYIDVSNARKPPKL